MGAENDHHVAVTAWFQRAARGRSVDSLIQAFEAGFGGVWRRSLLVLGEVTLAAILERVLHTAQERFPALAVAEIDGSGLRCQALRAYPDTQRDQLADATRFVLVEFLTVLGNLTGEILSPALHDELSTVTAVTDGEVS